MSDYWAFDAFSTMDKWISGFYVPAELRNNLQTCAGASTPMNIVTTPDSVLQIATQAMARTPDPRLRTVMAALTRHLHAFVQEVKLTEDEFERALEFLVAIGQASGEKKNEVVLAAHLLGGST